jgi:hypothetical protein
MTGQSIPLSLLMQWGPSRRFTSLAPHDDGTKIFPLSPFLRFCNLSKIIETGQQTEFQKKMSLEPTPGIVPIIDLSTLQVVPINFMA